MSTEKQGAFFEKPFKLEVINEEVLNSFEGEQVKDFDLAMETGEEVLMMDVPVIGETSRD